jgi:hypothetical protein
MAIEVETKDCTALGETEFEEMAELCGSGAQVHELEALSTQAGAWVLVTLVREGDALAGFAFCTLERIGGTPSILIGVGTIRRDAARDNVLKAIVTDQYRRAVLAFPDEDVLVGTRVSGPGGYEALASLSGVVPRPGHRANGEERAWGRRLAKRFGIDGDRYDDRAFTATGDGSPACVLDHEVAKPDAVPAEIAELFAGLDADRGDLLVVHGWAMAEDLESLL